MTPAIKLLCKLGIDHRINHYDIGGHSGNYGKHAATALGQDPHQVFKTLLAVLDDDQRQLVVAVVPVAMQLDTKKLAIAMGARRATMADPALAQRRTGYQIGGISPIGQRHSLKTVIDETAQLFDRVFVSAGKRGLELELAPDDLARACTADFIDICRQ